MQLSGSWGRNPSWIVTWSIGHSVILGSVTSPCVYLREGEILWSCGKLSRCKVYSPVLFMSRNSWISLWCASHQHIYLREEDFLAAIICLFCFLQKLPLHLILFPGHFPWAFISDSAAAQFEFSSLPLISSFLVLSPYLKLAFTQGEGENELSVRPDHNSASQTNTWQQVEGSHQT